ncbi:hypothetical protein GMRT_15226 [Giardia muris]|uniref:Uncharacterized protein n=1 Tax=Giardia muris TaxID=5742 RepID=A0A4Z1SR16_GIAMU|nr:hypothetical protein GMRT_15226 [Giardia muris]|eukprot:TNJ28150.1 hypothetical protein GMRT_15226 [Giardia muris]
MASRNMNLNSALRHSMERGQQVYPLTHIGQDAAESGEQTEERYCLHLLYPEDRCLIRQLSVLTAMEQSRARELAELRRRRAASKSLGYSAKSRVSSACGSPSRQNVSSSAKRYGYSEFTSPSGSPSPLHISSPRPSQSQPFSQYEASSSQMGSLFQSPRLWKHGRPPPAKSTFVSNYVSPTISHRSEDSQSYTECLRLSPASPARNVRRSALLPARPNSATASEGTLTVCSSPTLPPTGSVRKTSKSTKSSAKPPLQERPRSSVISARSGGRRPSTASGAREIRHEITVADLQGSRSPNLRPSSPPRQTWQPRSPARSPTGELLSVWYGLNAVASSPYGRRIQGTSPQLRQFLSKKKGNGPRGH